MLQEVADISPYPGYNAAIFLCMLHLICTHRMLPYLAAQTMPRELTIARSRSQVSQDKGKSSGICGCASRSCCYCRSLCIYLPAHDHCSARTTHHCPLLR